MIKLDEISNRLMQIDENGEIHLILVNNEENNDGVADGYMLSVTSSRPGRHGKGESPFE